MVLSDSSLAKRPCSSISHQQWHMVALVQTMALGGNQRARQFFKEHGWYELGSDKIEQKVSLLVTVSVCVLRQTRAVRTQ